METIHQLAVEIWPDTYRAILTNEQIEYMMDMMYSKKVLFQSIETNEQEFYLLIENEKAIGFIAIKKLEIPSTIKLNKIYILRSNQGKGYGKLLIDFTIDLCKNIGADLLQLNVNRNNPALSFYQKLGFKIIKEENILIGKGYFMDDYIMQMKIDNL